MQNRNTEVKRVFVPASDEISRSAVSNLGRACSGLYFKYSGEFIKRQGSTSSIPANLSNIRLQDEVQIADTG